MSEIEQLKERIINSGIDGVETSHIRDDYEPAGDLFIHQMLATGEFVSRRTPEHSYNSRWRIFKAGMEPY